jgi:hypothetical protein
MAISTVEQIRAIRVPPIEPEEFQVSTPATDWHLWASARYRFPSAKEARLHFLLDKQGEGSLRPGEKIELEGLLEEYEQRTLAKAEALVELEKRGLLKRGEVPT